MCIKKLVDDRVGSRRVDEAEVLSEPDRYLLRLEEMHQRLRNKGQLVHSTLFVNRLRAVADEQLAKLGRWVRIGEGK